MNVLLDTCVLAELRRTDGHAGVIEAVTVLNDDQLYVSVITLGEIEKGVALLPDSKRKQAIKSWLNGLSQLFADRILPIDQQTAAIWGEITARAQQEGVQIPAADGLIAATALCHGLHVMTRNTRDFAASGALLVDPWADTD